MEKNKIHKLTENDLDKLLNRAFLELDFNQGQNQALMESLAERSLNKSAFRFSIKTHTFSKLFIAVLVLASIASCWFSLKPRETGTKPDVVTELPSEKRAAATAHQPTQTIKRPAIAEKKQYPQKKNRSKIGLKGAPVNLPAEIPELQRVSMSGYVKSAKTGKPIAGAMVYGLSYCESTFTDDRGHFALSLAKGEHTIGVSLVGYQTLTLTIALQQDVARDIELTEVWKQLAEITVKPKASVFPNLTESEKKSNEREKKKMARQAAKLRRDKGEQKYAFIPAPANQPLKEFYMGGAEVSNLEYRTFLFDLLINDRKEEFLMAKPDQSLWINAAGVSDFDTLSLVYFSTRKYNVYPVVNIPVEGAKLYCQWLSQLANEIREKEGKPKIELRLPDEQEWQHAASGGHPGDVYAWPSDSVQNHYHWFLANLCIQKQQDKFKYPFNTTDKYPLGQPGRLNSKSYTSAGLATGNRKEATTATWSYNANDFNLYNVCGNVSEMVYARDSKSIKAKGGNWNSDADHVKLTSEDEFGAGVAASPMIGFRVCIEVKK